MKKLLSFVLWRFAIISIVVVIAGLLFEKFYRWNQKQLPKQPMSSEKRVAEPLKPKLNNPIPRSDLKEIPKSELEETTFPKNFFFGTASSDFQITGGTGKGDWDEYIARLAHENSVTVSPGIGTDFLRRYKEDFDLAAQFGNQVHRISLEWTRVEPQEGRFDQAAITKYKEIFSYMRSRGVEPMICLNHFTLPLWMAEKGGLESQEFPKYYSRYASIIAKEIGRPMKIKWWLTFNEPQVMLVPYTTGQWPPDKPIKSFQDFEGVERAMRVASNIIDAHRLSYRAIHTLMNDKKVMVSYASAPEAFYPLDPQSQLDQIASNLHTATKTLAFDYAVGRTDRDFVGINYYGRAKLKFHISFWGNVLPWLTKDRPFAIEWEMPDKRKQGNRPKEFYPRALYDLIMRFKTLNMPIVITENGLHDGDDSFREEFIVIHLKAVADAIKDGANVIGYQYWSLTDTWEWDGNFSKMGLVAINRENNLERKLRPSALTYGEIIKSHKISKELLEKHKELVGVR